MKIIKRGEDPTLKPVRAHCSRCKTQVEFMPNEAGVQYGSNPQGATWYLLQCPVCPTSIISYIQP